MTCRGPNAYASFNLVLLEGLEPPRHEGQSGLNRLCLPFQYTAALLVSLVGVEPTIPKALAPQANAYTISATETLTHKLVSKVRVELTIPKGQQGLSLSRIPFRHNDIKIGALPET